MDGFLVVSGVGSLVVAGACYVGFRNIQNVADYLQKTESLGVGKDLYEKVQDAPNHTLDYIAIRGEAKAVEATVKSSNVPAAKLLIQRTTIHEHKVEWLKNAKHWQERKKTISTVFNDVPFSLTSPNLNVSVLVDEPLSASGLDYSKVYDKYEPLHAISMSENLSQWMVGEKTKGLQTVEDGLLEGTMLTAVGKVVLQNGTLKVKPPDTYEYFLTKLPLDGLIREKTSSYRRWKYVTIGFAITGGILVLYWLYRRWKSWPSQYNRNILPPGNEELEPARPEEQLCVICLEQHRNVVILDCGHICACRQCASQVDTCPVCRAEIVRLVPTYQS